MNMIVEGLLDAGHRVRVLAVNSDKYFIEPSSIPLPYREKTGIELVWLDLGIKPLNAFLNLFTSRSYHVERFISRAFREKLEGMLQKETFDVVQFEMLYMSPYLETVRKLSKAKAVLRTHNIEHLIWERIAENCANPLKRLYVRHLARTLKKYELGVLSRFDGIAAITGRDADFFRERIRAGTGERETPEIISIPFGIDVSRLPEPSGDYEFPSLFSLGAMNWIPNEEGIRWFLERVWPEVHSRFPDLRYYIAGRYMPEWLIRGRYPNVTVVGEVGDAWEFMNSKAIMIVPLFSGSGIRIKIIEGMAAGKAILSTTIGAEGIQCADGKEILIADDPGGFVRGIAACVSSPELCRSIGQNARNRILETYDRKGIISGLVDFYRRIGA